jgi:hypothetical protein
MIAQGTDSLSRGTPLEDVLAGNDMLSYTDLLWTAIKQYPPILDYVQGWLEPAAGKGRVLEPREWFVEGHSIIGGKRDNTGFGSHSLLRTGRPTSGVPPSDSRCCTGGVYEGGPQEDGRLPHFPDTQAVLHPLLVAHVV